MLAENAGPPSNIRYSSVVIAFTMSQVHRNAIADVEKLCQKASESLGIALVLLTQGIDQFAFKIG